MKHLGDIAKINGAEIEPVDVITGGSPCQDLSIAGKRAGLDGERSGLFMEQIRIVKEMRDATSRATNDIRLVKPRFMVWENVPGAFSSNGGRDFQAVITEIIKIAEPESPNVPMPDRGGGHTADASMMHWVDGALLGAYTMHSFGESPKEENALRLSQILEDYPHPKYYLSAKACAGILARAERRGRKLPARLEFVLKKQARLVFKNEQESQGEARES